MTEDFIIEDDGSSAANSRRPFLVAVGILLTILVLSMICSATLLLRRNSAGNNNDEIAAIETKNAQVMAANAAVTQTIAARATEDARPTDTPVAPPTNTPRPTSTPQPTNTPVVQQAEELTATPDVPGTATAVASGITSGGTPTPISALGGGGNEALPQTGIETWGALVAAFVLMGILLAARRLRSH